MLKFDLNGGKQLVSERATLELKSKKFSIGSVEYEPNEALAYFTFTLANSWPKVNDNTVSFSPKTMTRSHATVKNNPLNIEHQVEGNGIPLFEGNQIIGHMIDSYTEVEDGSTGVVVAGVLYKRIEKAMDIIADIASGGGEWKISMEVLYSPSESGFMLAKDETYIPLENAEEDLIDAFQTGSSLYNGEKFAFLAGGLGDQGDESEPNVNFWGAALTIAPADKDATVHTMVARKLPKALIGAGEVPRVVLFSDGSVESTRLLIDGAEVANLMDVDFSSWGAYDEKIWLQWTTEPEDVGGVAKMSRYTLIANEIIGDIGMIKMKEFLENFPAQISEAVATAIAALKADESLDLEAIKAVIAEKIGELEGFISPDELEAKAEELAVAKIKDRDDLIAKMKLRSDKAETAGVVMTEARLKELAKLEDDGVDPWIESVKTAFASMVASLEEEHKVTLGDDVTEPLKAFSGIESPEFKGYKSAIAVATKSGASIAVKVDEDDGGKKENKNQPTGW